MSGLFNASIYATAFGLALLGGGHCLGMCGPIAVQVAGKRGISYQLARLAGYIAVGALAGGVGEGFFAFFRNHPFLQPIALTLMISLMGFQAYALWRGTPDGAPAARAYRVLHRGLFAKLSAPLRLHGGAVGLGLMTALLPCGLFVSYALLAAASASAAHGAILFALLWAGSLPALLLAMWGRKWVLRATARPIVRKISAVMILALGLSALSMSGPRAFPASASGPVDLVCGH